MSGEGVCFEFLNKGEIRLMDHVHPSLFTFLLGWAYIIMGAVIVYLVKRNEVLANRQEDEGIAPGVIFPVYKYILYANCAINIYVGVVAWVYTFDPTNNPGESWAFAVMWGMQHVVIEGVAVLLMQKGVGMHACKQSLKRTGVWGLFTMFSQLIIYKAKPVASFSLSIVWQCMLLVFYAVLWLAPQKNFFRRPAAIPYGKSWFWFRLLSILGTVLFYAPRTHDAGNCVYVIGTLYPFAILEPLLLYYTLLQDSRWWQGVEIHQGYRHSRRKSRTGTNAQEEEIRGPLAGIDLGMKAAQSLAAQMDTMEIGQGSANNSLYNGSASASSSHASFARAAKGGVRLLNFAYITLDRSNQLGSGSFSKVFLGKYRNRECAIKLIFTVDLTQDVIRRITAEAQLLSYIQHPNIVDIVGVAVMPPSVCILLELCQYGSLADVLKSVRTSFTGGGLVDNSVAMSATSILRPRPPQFTSDTSKITTLSWADRLYFAVGCARGLAALHAYDISLCHRDVKSFNFLVDRQFNAKLSDLELGIAEGGSGSTTRPAFMRQETASSATDSTRAVVKSLKRRKEFSFKKAFWGVMESVKLLGNREPEEPGATPAGAAAERLSQSFNVKSSTSPIIPRENSIGPMSITSLSGGDSRNVSTDSHMQSLGDGVLKAEDFLANWSAPEVVRDGVHVQGSDVYAFSLVLWEIITGLVPFHEVRLQDDIRYKVLCGERPVIPADFLSGPDAPRFEQFISLIKRGWAQEAAMRPTIFQILAELENIWQNVCQDLLHSNVPLRCKRSTQLQSLAPTTTTTTTTTNATHASPLTVLGSTTGSTVTNTSVSSGIFSSWISAASLASVPVQPNHTYSCSRISPLSIAVLEQLGTVFQEGSLSSMELLENDSNGWLLVSHVPPFTVLHCTGRWCQQFGFSPEEVVGMPLRAIDVFSEEWTSMEDKEAFLEEIAGLNSLSKGAHSTLALQTKARRVSRCGGISTETNYSPVLASMHSFPIVREVEIATAAAAAVAPPVPIGVDSPSNGDGAQVGNTAFSEDDIVRRNEEDSFSEESLLQANTLANSNSGRQQQQQKTRGNSFSPAAAISAMFDSSKRKQSFIGHNEIDDSAAAADMMEFHPGRSHVALLAIMFSVVKNLSPPAASVQGGSGVSSSGSVPSSSTPSSRTTSAHGSAQFTKSPLTSMLLSLSEQEQAARAGFPNISSPPSGRQQQPQQDHRQDRQRGASPAAVSIPSSSSSSTSSGTTSGTQVQEAQYIQRDAVPIKMGSPDVANVIEDA